MRHVILSYLVALTRSNDAYASVKFFRLKSTNSEKAFTAKYKPDRGNPWCDHTIDFSKFLLQLSQE